MFSTSAYESPLTYSDTPDGTSQGRQPGVARTAPAAAGARDTQDKPEILLDSHFRIRSANRKFCEKFGVSPLISNGTLLFQLEAGCWEQRAIRKMLADVLKGGTAQECKVTMELPGEGHCILHLSAERRANRGPMELIAISIEECLKVGLPPVTEPGNIAPDQEAVRLSRSLISVSRSLHRELAMIVGCAQAILEIEDPDARESALEILAAVQQIQANQTPLVQQARALIQTAGPVKTEDDNRTPALTLSHLRLEESLRVGSSEEPLAAFTLSTRVHRERSAAPASLKMI